MSRNEIGVYMVEVVLTALKDYRTFRRSNKKNAKRLFREAEYYFFNNDKESLNYIFGFIFICKFLGIDYKKIRQELKNETNSIFRVSP